MHIKSIGLLALPVTVAFSGSVLAQGITPLPDVVICISSQEAQPGLTPPAPAGPQCFDRMLMLRDIDNNGDYDGMPDEIASFVETGCFDATFRGIRAAEMRVESGDATVYWVNKTDCLASPEGLWRAQDANLNGAIEMSEQNLFFGSSSLEDNGVAGTTDGAVWFSDQNFFSASASAGLWRLLDVGDGTAMSAPDGDAMDAGEAVRIVAPGQMVPTMGGPMPIDTAYFQTIASEGNRVVTYSGTNDNATDECLMAFEDSDMNGDVAGVGEALVFLNGTGKNPVLDMSPDFGMGLPVRDLTQNNTFTPPTHARLVNFDVATQTHDLLQNAVDVTGPYWYMGTDSSSGNANFTFNVNGLSLNGLILRGFDANGDGDINDSGEVITWYDGGISGTGTIEKILGLEVVGDSVYILDLLGGTFGIHQLTDLNDDGDASDLGEFITIGDANLWGGASPLGVCGGRRDNSGGVTTHSGPFVVDFAIIDHGTWEAPNMGVNPFTDFCNGDGGNQMGCTNCPCGNNAPMGTIGGCLNSGGTSTRLSATGDLSVSLPAGTGTTTDLRFTASGAPGGAFCVLLSGDAVAPQNMANMCFGLDSGAQAVDRDGLRCAVMNIKRHGGRSANAMGEIMAASGPDRVWGGEAQPHGGIFAQGGFAAGQTRFFQITHRENPLAVCTRGLNTSQAVGLTFTP